MTAPTQTMQLRDGRTLAYSGFGAETGSTILYFNGTMGSRLEARIFDGEARRLGLRVIGLDRPGHGLSSAQPDRTFASWVEDVRELADSLGLERFGVMGLS